MSMTKGDILFLLSLGVLLIANSVESECKCRVVNGVKKMINDYCCESVGDKGTKDACCHVDGLAKNPPIWVPDGSVPEGPETPETKAPAETTPTALPTDLPTTLPTGEPTTDDGAINPDVCEANSECKGEIGECPGNATQRCACAKCECVCEDKITCNEDNGSCRRDEDCPSTEFKMTCDNCMCVGGEMSPDACEDTGCTSNQQCEQEAADAGQPMNCECSNCECLCDSIGEPVLTDDDPFRG